MADPASSQNSPPAAAPAAAPPAAGAAGSQAAPPAAAPAAAPAAQTWPDNWRSEFAGGDAKLQARFERYASPKDAANALIAVQNRIASGEMRSVLPKDATPEQVTAWRAENGIPASPDKYDLTGFNGNMVVGENDKPVIDAFLASAHAANLTTDQAKASVAWYFETVQKQHEAMAANDAIAKQKSEDALRAEYGTDFRTNANIVQNLLSTAPQGFADVLMGARAADGTLLANHPDMHRMLTQFARAINPMATVVPSSINPQKGVTDEIGEIEKYMRENRAAYNKDEVKQARLRDLYAARERMAPK